MNVSEISFCGCIGFNIKSDDTKKMILQKLEKTYGIKVVVKHYDRFEEKSMSIINNNLHLISARTNGNPYFLYLVKINFTNYCIFIDKKIQQGYYYPRMIIVHLFIEDSLFDKDVIFDGEMIKSTNNKWFYMINDILVSNGKYLGDLNLVRRMNLCYELLDKHYKVTNTDIFKIMIKKYFTYDELNYILSEFIPSRQYTCRGLYFKPLYLKFRDILINFDDTLICKVERIKFKNVKNFLQLDDIENKAQDDLVCQILVKEIENKEIEKSNIRKFLAKKTNNPDVYELFDLNGTMIDIACIQNLNISKKMRLLFGNINLLTKLEISCEFSEKFKKWIPLFL
jgi:hypothetical protein